MATFSSIFIFVRMKVSPCFSVHLRIYLFDLLLRPEKSIPCYFLLVISKQVVRGIRISHRISQVK